MAPRIDTTTERKESTRLCLQLSLLVAIAAFALVIGNGTALAAIGTITIDPKAKLSADHMQATVTGTINCLAGDQVNMFANITETIGRVQRFARNLDLNTIDCTGAVQPWSVVVTATSSTLRLLPGPANVGAFAFDQSDFAQGSTLGRTLLVR